MAQLELPEIKYFFSHVCPYCPQAKKMLEKIESQLEGKATIKEFSTLTPKGRSEAMKLGIMSIPTIAIGDEIIVRGLPKNAEDLLEKIQAQIKSRP